MVFLHRPGAFSVYGTVFRSLRLRRGPGTHASVPGNLPLCRTIGGRLVCSPHRSSLRLPHGSKDMCRSLRGRADQLRGGEISLCTLQSSKSHVSRRFRLSHVCFPGPFVIFCLFYLRASAPSRGPGQPDLPERTRPGLLSGQHHRKGTDEAFRDRSQRRDHES